jgi:hypothetical protein
MIVPEQDAPVALEMAQGRERGVKVHVKSA